MRLNAVVFLCVSALTYALTLYFDHGAPPVARPVIVQPASIIQRLPEGESLPVFSFQTPDGTRYDSKMFRDKIILLNFWASWCPPCVKEFPALLDIARAFPDEVVLIALSSDMDEPAMQTFVNKLPLGVMPKNVFVAFDRDQTVTQKIFQTFQLPETIVIDKAQIMRHKIAGADWEPAELKKQISASR